MSATAKVSQVNYNRAVKAAKAASAKVGTFNWTIGDLAGNVATEYGDNSIKRFADDIGQEVTSVRNMRTVSAAYPETKISRTLQGWTVYAVFTSQDDRFALVKDGNDGKPWSVSAARALVKSRKDAAKLAENGGEGGEGGSETPPAEDTLEVQLAKQEAEVKRLTGELTKAQAKVDAIKAQISARTPAEPAKDETPAPAARNRSRGAKRTPADPAKDETPAAVVASATQAGTNAARSAKATQDAKSESDVTLHVALSRRAGSRFLADHLRTEHGVTDVPAKLQAMDRLHTQAHAQAAQPAKGTHAQAA